MAGVCVGMTSIKGVGENLRSQCRTVAILLYLLVMTNLLEREGMALGLVCDRMASIS